MIRPGRAFVSHLLASAATSVAADVVGLAATLLSFAISQESARGRGIVFLLIVVPPFLVGLGILFLFTRRTVRQDGSRGGLLTHAVRLGPPFMIAAVMVAAFKVDTRGQDELGLFWVFLWPLIALVGGIIGYAMAIFLPRTRVATV